MNKKKYIKMYINHFPLTYVLKNHFVVILRRKNLIPMYSVIDWLINQVL